MRALGIQPLSRGEKYGWTFCANVGMETAFSVIVRSDRCRLMHFSVGKTDHIVHMDGHSVQMLAWNVKFRAQRVKVSHPTFHSISV